MVVDGFGCEIGMGQWVAKLAWVWWLQDWLGLVWVVLAMGDGFWQWVQVVLGLLLFLFWVVVGLMSVGVVGFVIDGGGFNGC